MDIIERVRTEHMDILASMNDLLNGPIEDAEKYGRAYLDLMVKVDAHERGEEQTIYQAIATDIDMRPIALQSMEEHLSLIHI